MPDKVSRLQFLVRVRREKLVLTHYRFTTQSRPGKQGQVASASVCSLTRDNRGAIAGLSNNEGFNIALLRSLLDIYKRVDH